MLYKALVRRGLAIVFLFFGFLLESALPGRGAERLQAPGADDLVVFIAREKPRVYRLVGRRPIPWSSAAFERPEAITADQDRRCFFVIDRPHRIGRDLRVWKILPDGTATVICRFKNTDIPFEQNVPMGLGLDAGGRLLIANSSSKIFLVPEKGPVRSLTVDDRSADYITAATGQAGGGLFFATSFFDEPHPAIPSLSNRTQGGLFSADTNSEPARVRQLVENRRQGDKYYDTHWRTIRHVFTDSEKRIVLVDGGSRKAFEDSSRKTVSEINGGVWVYHPDGSLEDLTYKTPTRTSGPMRHPGGAAEWDKGVYLIADPGLYTEGAGGTGGLLLLSLDGSREARWKFGGLIQPVAVAILRGAGAEPGPIALPVNLKDLIGVHRAGPILNVFQVVWEKQPPGSLLGSMGTGWEAQSQEKAVDRLKKSFENTRWEIAANGSLRFNAPGLDSKGQGPPWVLQGRVIVNEDLVLARASYRPANLFDTTLFSLNAMIQCPKAGELIASTEIYIFHGGNRLRGEFEQRLVLNAGQAR